MTDYDPLQAAAADVVMHLPDGGIQLVGTEEELATYKRELLRAIIYDKENRRD